MIEYDHAAGTVTLTSGAVVQVLQLSIGVQALDDAIVEFFAMHPLSE